MRNVRVEFKKHRLVSKTLALRLRALIELAKRRSNIATSYSDLDYFFVSDKFGCAVRTLQRWASEYTINGIDGLTSKKRSNKPKIIIKGWTAAKILEYRKLYNWGAETIQAHLALDHATILSEYKINAEHQLVGAPAYPTFGKSLPTTLEIKGGTFIESA